MPVKATDLPTDLLHAFVDALEAWTRVEHDLFMIYQLLAGTTQLDRAWHTFTGMSPRQQLSETSALIAAKVRDEADRNHFARLLKRVRRLSIKRNHAVHGHWRQTEVVGAGNRHLRFEYIRVYEGRGLMARPTNDREADAMRGRTRFDAQDLQRAEREFKELARDLHMSIERLTKYVLPRLR